MTDVLAIQKRLKSLGFNPGPLDGIKGKLTTAAIMSFQRTHMLQPDGIVGPKTRAVLFPDSSRVKAPAPEQYPWLIRAQQLLGTKEAPGAADNPLIIGWGKKLKIDYAKDEIPWCGLFVAHCISETLPHEPLPTNPLGARNWLKFGVSSKPQPGAVMVFWRGSKSGWQGHVGFYWAEDKDAYHVLGGNQSNAVTITRMAKGRLLGARWPKTFPLGKGGPRYADAKGKLSVNEA